MATRDRIVSIPFSRGLDTKTNDILSEKPLVIENARIDDSRVLRKRNGLDPLPKTISDLFGSALGAISNCAYMYRYNNDLYLNNGEKWYRYSNIDFWEEKESHKLFNLKQEFDDQEKPYEYKDSIEYNGKTFAYAYDYDNVLSRFLLLNADGTVDVQSPTTLFPNDYFMSHDMVTDGTHIYFAFEKDSTNQLIILKFDSSLNVVASSTTAYSILDGRISLSINASELVLSYSSSFQVYSVKLDFTLTETEAIYSVNTPTAGDKTVEAITSVSTPSETVIIFEYSYTTGKENDVIIHKGSTGANFELARFNGTLLSQVKSHTEQEYVVHSQGNDFLLDANSIYDGLVSKIRNFTSRPVASVDRLPNIFEDADKLRIDENTYLYNDFTEVSDSIEFSGVENIFGSTYKINDGKKTMPLPFYQAPKFYEVDSSVGSGGFSGNLEYLAIYKFTDKRGNIYESIISDQFTFTAASHSSVLFTFEYPNSFSEEDFTDDKGATTFDIELYRKLDSELVYKYVPNTVLSSSTVVGSGVYHYVQDPLVDNSAEKPIYSDGSTDAEVQNDPAPPSRGGCFHNGRIFLIDSTKKNNIRYSKYYTPNIGVSFPEAFNLQIEDNQDREADELTGIQSMDSKLIMFKNNSVLVLYGEGPDDTGANSDYTEPEIVSTDNGCIEPRSLILTSLGVFYKSRKGIWLLTRSLESVYIGAGVESFNDEQISGVVHLDSLNEVRFTTVDGNTLVYNYFEEQWTTFTSMPAVSSVNYNGKFTYAKSDGTVNVEHDGFRDDGAFISRRIDTGWLRTGEVGARQRIKRIGLTGEYIDDHQLKISTYHDYEKYAWSEYTLTPQASGYNITAKPAISDYYSGTNDGVFEYNVHIERQVGQAMRIVFEDLDTGSTEEGFKMANMSIRAASKKGQHKIVENKRF